MTLNLIPSTSPCDAGSPRIAFSGDLLPGFTLLHRWQFLSLPVWWRPALVSPMCFSHWTRFDPPLPFPWSWFTSNSCSVFHVFEIVFCFRVCFFQFLLQSGLFFFVIFFFNSIYQCSQEHNTDKIKMNISKIFQKCSSKN